MNMTTTVADLLVDRLIEWGVDTVFSLPGDGINGIFESLRQRQDRITMIQVRHEWPGTRWTIHTW
jgi:pyruvate dehydrogenase (quinone)